MNTNTAKLINDLKEALVNEEAVKEYLAARDAYVADKTIVTLANEYNVQREVYENESAKAEKDTLLLTSIKSRLDTLEKQITEKETATRLFAAEDGINQLYNGIFQALQSVVVPEHHDGCSGNCSSCGGCH